MFTKKTRQDQDGPEALEVTEVLEVLIRRDGSAMIAGAPVAVPRGEPVHGVVLDALHHHALTRGTPVEAAIDDRQEGSVTHIEVAPDGSSRMLRDAEYQEQPPSEPGPASGPPPSAAPPSDPPAAGPAWDLEPSAAELQRAEVDTPLSVPNQLADLVSPVTQALRSGSLERAAALSFRLRAHTMRVFGANHPYTLEARSLEAYTAHQRGDYGTAMTTCLELARIRHQLGDPHASEELARAAAAWWLIDDPLPAIDHGKALAAVWSELTEQRGRTGREAELIGHVNRRLRKLAVMTAASEPGPVSAGTLATSG
ncbi:hypothetical protein [Streptomyces sp. NPDC059850]|uniref:hypothetical protein n=1 Tax=Streptomyces sp. NPDC059850 TaxID=3346970 RepID=UPI0036541B73